MRARLNSVSGGLRLAVGAWLLASCGGWAFTTAIAVYAFHRSGAGGVAGVTVARLLPAAVAAPVSGRFIDRGDRGRVAAVACAAQAAVLVTAAAVIRGGASLPFVALLAALFSIATSAPRPALQSLMPALARTPEELARASAAWGAIDNLAFLLGGGVGGAAIGLIGEGDVVLGAAAALGLAAICASRLPVVVATSRDEPESGEEEGLMAALEGIRVVGRSPLLRAAFVLFAGLLLLEGTTDVQVVALALGPLHLGSGGAGVMFFIWGAGGIVGSALILGLVRRRGYGLVFAIGAVVFGAGLAAAGIPSLAVALAAMIPAGIGFAFVETAMISVIPRLADDSVVGRVYALSEVLYGSAGCAGALLAPPLIRVFGVSGSLVVVGVAYAACALLGWPAFLALDRGQEVAGRLRELVRGIGFLAPLPLPRLERLVRDAHALEVGAGEVIITLGERGEEFFMIERGEVEVVEYQRCLGTGEGFGEIALLHDVPRTATVRATVQTQLWVLTRRAFIGAVSAHADASRLAEAVIAGHLSQPRKVNEL
ncbi:MAG: MFS transporter [Solirubrobacteraceae bacterium]